MLHARVAVAKASQYKSEFLKFALAITFSLCILTTFGQDKVIHQGSYWIRYYNQTQFTDKLMFNFHVDERRLVNPSRQFQLFFHAHLNYLIKPWMEVGFGGNFNWTNSNQNPDLRVPEWRPWQEINLIQPMPRKIQFQFRYRIDERFIHNNDGLELEDGYRFNLRHRFRVQWLYTLKTQNTSKSLVFRASDEVMINTGDVADTFDQNRIYTSVQYPFNKSWSTEVGYLNILQSRARDDHFYDRHTIRVTFYHKIDLRKPE
jgi:hypothetical protein